MHKIILILFTISMVSSCGESEPRRPINKQKQVFLKESAKRNRSKINIEQNLFDQVIKKDTTLKFYSSPLGFWYAFKKKGEIPAKKPIKGDRVTFEYRIEDLNQNLLYDEDQLGIVSFHVDQEDLIPALREGVKYMTEGDVVVFLFPSYLCFGYQGDGEKIGINQPLRFTIEMLKIEKNK
ncbi:MAG: gliding motility-associated peptidyl-prolyl isomerase GldI [Flavobacteriaceae bacterium]|nr:gliding motility-associated peptidyl-prolyl isomerase GldI [Flavobacteriaceae bacterium]